MTGVTAAQRAGNDGRGDDATGEQRCIFARPQAGGHIRGRYAGSNEEKEQIRPGGQGEVETPGAEGVQRGENTPASRGEEKQSEQRRGRREGGGGSGIAWLPVAQAVKKHPCGKRESHLRREGQDQRGEGKKERDRSRAASRGAAAAENLLERHRAKQRREEAGQ